MSKSNDFTKILQRIVGQVRFVPTLSSWQDTVEVSKNFQDDFEHWRIANRQDVALFSPKESKLLQVLYNSILYLNENSENTAELSEKLKKAFTLINKDNNKFEHLGFRNVQILGCKFEFNELVDLLYKKIYTNDILSISSDEVKDVLFSVNAVKDGISNNVVLGPVTKEEGLQRFNSQFDIDGCVLEMDKYKSFIFIDVDTYIKSNEGINNIDALLAKNLEITSSYIDYINK